jgi:hypothetical protein
MTPVNERTPKRLIGHATAKDVEEIANLVDQVFWHCWSWRTRWDYLEALLLVANAKFTSFTKLIVEPKGSHPTLHHIIKQEHKAPVLLCGGG